MKHNFLKKLTAFLLVTVMLVALIPTFTLPAFAADANTYTLVTDVTDLAAGDKVIIVATAFDVAMSTTQNNNNRAGVEITKNGNTITIGATVQVFTLEAGKKANTFAFNTGSGYIYAASSSSNHLKTETTLSDNSSFTISIAATGVATVKAQGTNTKNWMRYNSNNNLFSCYLSGQADIQIYKNTSTNPDCTHENVVNCECQNPDCDYTSHDYQPDATASVAATCTTPGATVETCTKCQDSKEPVPVAASGHKYVDGVCTNDGCGSAEITSLKVGDTIYLVGQSGTVVKELASINATDDRGDAAELNGGSSCWFEIVAGATEGTIAFSVKGTKTYLSWSSGNSLITSDSVDANSSWTVTYSTKLTIANSADSERILQFNKSSKDRFCCYTSDQAPVYAYAYEAPVEARSWNLALNEGVKINVKAFIPQAWIEANAGAKVGFYNGDVACTEVAPTAGEFTYSVTLKPTELNNDMKFIIKDKTGATVVEKSVKIADYKTAVYETASTELQALLDSLIVLANAADSDAATVVGDLNADGLTDSTIGITGTLNVLDGGLGAVLSDSASALFEIAEGDYTGYKLSAKRGSVVLVENGNFVDYLESDGYNTWLEITDLYAADYNDVIEITISNDTAEQQISFQFNTYLSTLYHQLSSSDDALKELVLATYLYGVAAEAYVTAAA